MAGKHKRVTRIERRAVINFTLPVVFGVLALAAMVCAQFTSWRHSDIMALLFLIVFFCFIMSIVMSVELVRLAGTKKRMASFEGQHTSFSKLYYGKLGKRDKATIFDVVHLIDNSKPTKGFDEFGWYYYLIDKVEGTDGQLISKPTYITISPAFYLSRCGVNPKGAVVLDFIFMVPRSRNVLVYNDKRRTFGVHHKWGGEDVVQDDALAKALEEYQTHSGA